MDERALAELSPEQRRMLGVVPFDVGRLLLSFLLAAASYGIVVMGGVLFSIFAFGFSSPVYAERPTVLAPLGVAGLVAIAVGTVVTHLLKEHERGRGFFRQVGITTIVMWMAISASYLGLARLVPDSMLPQAPTGNDGWVVVDVGNGVREYFTVFRSDGWSRQRRTYWGGRGPDGAPAGQYLPILAMLGLLVFLTRAPRESAGPDQIA